MKPLIEKINRLIADCKAYPENYPKNYLDRLFLEKDTLIQIDNWLLLRGDDFNGVRGDFLNEARNLIELNKLSPNPLHAIKFKMLIRYAFPYFTRITAFYELADIDTLLHPIKKQTNFMRGIYKIFGI